MRAAHRLQFFLFGRFLREALHLQHFHPFSVSPARLGSALRRPPKASAATEPSVMVASPTGASPDRSAAGTSNTESGPATATSTDSPCGSTRGASAAAAFGRLIGSHNLWRGVGACGHCARICNWSWHSLLGCTLLRCTMSAHGVPIVRLALRLPGLNVLRDDCSWRDLGPRKRRAVVLRGGLALYLELRCPRTWQ